MNGGNDQQPKTPNLREEIASILPQQKSADSPAPSSNRPAFPPSGAPKPATPPPRPITPPIASRPSPPKPTSPGAPPARRVPPPITPPPITSKPKDSAGQKYVLRTMPSDVKSLQKGDQPTGLNVEKSGKTMPRPRRPAQLAPSGPPPKLKLGPIQKTAPISPPSLPSRITPPSGIKPPPSPPSLPPKITPPSGIKPPPSAAPVGPPGKKSSLGIIIGAVIVAIVAYGAVWFFFLREAEPAPSPTPIPTETPTPTPVVSSLEDIFGFTDPISIASDDFNPHATLDQAISSELVDLNEVRPFVIVDENGLPYDFASLLELFGVSVPLELIDVLDIDDFIFVVYGQTEEFDDEGNLVFTSGSVAKFKRIGFVVKITDNVTAKSALTDWEDEMSTALAELLQLEGKTPGSSTFADNVYNGVSVRYINFPNPDLSIDYTISSSFIGNNYLVLTNSREEIYSIVDNLLGFLAE